MSLIRAPGFSAEFNNDHIDIEPSSSWCGTVRKVGEGEAQMTDDVAFWTMVGAVGTVVAAVMSVATAIIALIAASTWWRGLKAQRIDDCVAAFHDCAAAIGRSISRRANVDHPNWDDVADAWSAWSRARTAYAVVSTRYFPNADKGLIDRGVGIMKTLNGFAGQPQRPTEQAGASINSKFGQLISEMEHALR